MLGYNGSEYYWDLAWIAPAMESTVRAFARSVRPQISVYWTIPKNQTESGACQMIMRDLEIPPTDMLGFYASWFMLRSHIDGLCIRRMHHNWTIIWNIPAYSFVMHMQPWIWTYRKIPDEGSKRWFYHPYMRDLRRIALHVLGFNACWYLLRSHMNSKSMALRG